MKRGCSKEGVPTVVEVEVCNKYMLYTSIIYTILNYIYMVCIKLSKGHWRDAQLRTLVALTKDLGSIPRTHIRVHNLL